MTIFVRGEDDLTAWQRDWSNYHALLAVAQLGLFDLLTDGEARTADTIAEQLKADVRAIDICGRILTRAGLLSYNDGKFRLTDSARALTAPLNELKWEWRRRQNYADLLETIRTGQPAMSTSGGVVQEDEADARQFLTMLHRRSAAPVQEALKVMREIQAAQPDQRQWRILDLGGGHGRYAATFAAELPHAEATLFDRELATRIARELSGNGFATRSSDFLKDDLGGPYGIAFMAYVVSGIALDEARALLERLRQVIVPGGSLVIQDMFVDPERNLQPGFAIDFQLTLLLENEQGRFRTVPELSGLLDEAGFPSTRHVPVEDQDYSFIVGR